MSDIFERLMDDSGPTLSYAEIAELRALCNAAKARQSEIAADDFFIRQVGEISNVILITADGLECNYRGTVAYGARRVRTALRSSMTPIAQGLDPSVECKCREYEFESVRGSAGNRTAVFREIVR